MTEIANGEWNLPVYNGLSNWRFGSHFMNKRLLSLEFEYFL